jgi:hypothetical protein
MVPHNATAAEFAQNLDDGVRSRPQRRHVAKTDDWSTPVRRISASTARSATSFAWISEIRAIRVIGMT